MRTHGTLSKWNEAQASGFVSPAEGGPEVFVQMASMPRDGMRPRLGEELSFETETGPDGTPRAVRVLRSANRASVAEASRRRRTGAARTKLAIGLILAALIAYFLVDRFYL